jgi:hypothetical protein
MQMGDGSLIIIHRLFRLFFFDGGFGAFFFDIHANEHVEAHVYIRYPYDGETRDEVTAPVCVQQGIARDNEH